MTGLSSDRQTLVLLVRPGQDVVGRVTGLLRSRQVLLESISVARTAAADNVQLTLVIYGDAENARRVVKQLARLIPVLHVENIGSRPHVARSLALIKLTGVDDNRPRISEICREFWAHVIDESSDTVIVEVSGEADEIDNLTEKLEPLGILEITRHGAIAMGTGERTFQEGIHAKPALSRAPKPA